MHAHHGQERQQRRGSQHGKHIAKVGGSGHLDILDHIGISLAAFDDALLQHHQVFFQQNNVRRFLRYIHRGIHRDADISSFHGGSVIDAVPHKADSVAVFPKDGYDTRLLIWGQLGKTSVDSATLANSSSLMCSRSDPSSIFRTFNPTCLQMVRVTLSLSPVRISVVTPWSFKA